MPDLSSLASGHHLIEGRLEQDPMTDEYLIRTVDSRGKPETVRLNGVLESLKGQDVRFTLVSFEILAKLAAMAEEAGTGQVMGIQAADIPGVRKSG